MSMERRHAAATIELRTDNETDTRTLVGYAAVFFRADDPGTEFALAPDYTERIAPGAFTRAIRESDDVRALFNHSSDHLLGRTGSGTLRLSEDARGLRYEIDLPNTSTAAEVRELIARGDLTGSSFAFTVDEQEHQETAGKIIRTVTSVTLYDVGPVTYPAYEATTVDTRSIDAARANSAPPAVAPEQQPIARDIIEATARTAAIS